MSTAIPMPKRDDQTLSLRIPREWYEDLRKRAFEARRPIAEFIRDAIQQRFDYADPETHQPEEGGKGGARYPEGGIRAAMIADRK